MTNHIISERQANKDFDLDQEIKFNSETFQQTAAADFFPRLACQINLYSDRLILSQYGQEFAFPIDEPSGKGLYKLFLLMNGTRSLRELQQLCSPENPTAITKLLCSLDDQGLLDNAAPVKTYSGSDTLQELEALTQQLLNHKLFGHSPTDIPLWQLLQLATPEIPDKVIYGFILEHYHLFSHTSYFQSPTLGFQGSAKIRHLLNELYIQTYGYEELMVAALNGIGVAAEDLPYILPLPETMSIYNGLAFWANFEPLFFLSILGSLFDGILSCFERYFVAIEKRGQTDGFIEPIRQLIESQQTYEQLNLTREIFQEIPHIDPEVAQRFKAQIHLFVEMYLNFYKAIGHYYMDAPDLLRRIAVN
ncbi:MAG: hypothetical protein AAGI69_24680 [Cyanobacteria bacterium P01_H01_bin.21]